VARGVAKSVPTGYNRAVAKPRLFAHICCAPDGLYTVGLLQETYDVTGYFYNPNIHPEEEYHLRLHETRRVAGRLGFELLEDVYDADRWLALTAHVKDEPEKGRRCDVCYAIRLRRAAETAAARGFGLLTTVMSLSPWKKADVLNRLGRVYADLAGLRFLEADFKKGDGFNKSVALSRAQGLYRQNFCGCLYSRREP